MSTRHHFKGLRSSLGCVVQCVLLLLVTGCASEGSHAMDEAKQAYTQQDYVTSYTKVAEQAHAGDADAQYALGYMMYYGKGTQRDIAGSYDWFRKAAAQGQPQAVKALALLGQASQGGANPGASQDASEAPSQNPDQGAKEAAVDTPHAVSTPEAADAETPDATTLPSSSPTTDPTAKDAMVGDAPQAQHPETPALTPDDAMAQPVKDHHAPDPASKPASDAATTPQAAHDASPHYAVQLMGGHSPEALQMVAKQYHLKAARVVKTTVRGQPWYVLLQGDFRDHESAMAAMQALPDDLRAHHPWVRRSH